MATRYIIGVDEAGRGPLAGPVSVAAVAIPVRHFRAVISSFREAKDSKRLSVEKRELWLRKIRTHPSRVVLHAVSLVGGAFIDRFGIARAVRVAVKRTLSKLPIAPQHAKVLLDGSLVAPSVFENQRTVIGGDERVKVIALASIIAKVRRDRHMVRKAREFPKYGFEIHKGYGTKNHQMAIRKHGPSIIHRRSFLKKLLPA